MTGTVGGLGRARWSDSVHHLILYPGADQGQVSISDSGSTYWRHGLEDEWQEVNLPRNAALAIFGSVALSLDLLEWTTNRIEEARAGNLPTASLPDDTQAARTRAEELRLGEQIQQGILYPGGPVEVYLPDADDSIHTRRDGPAWTQESSGEDEKAVVRIIRHATANLIMEDGRAQRALAALDPAFQPKVRTAGS